MKACLLLLFVLLHYAGLRAQDSTVVSVRSGNNIAEVLTDNNIFLYPQFMPGKVFFGDGSKSAAMMNYHSLNDQMLFIDPKGDTLALAEEETIKFIALAKDTFYYHEGYLRLVQSNSFVKLAEHEVWKQIDIRKIGSHDRPATTYAVSSYSTVTDKWGKGHNLLLNEDYVLSKKAHYYFGDTFNHFVLADKKNLLMLFPKEQSRISEYLKENKVRFDNGEDLKKLVDYLAGK